jgi:hypothetical protein
MNSCRIWHQRPAGAWGVTLYPCRLTAPIAQSVERFHGKEKVNGSIPFGGSDGKTAGQSGVAQVVEQAAHNRCVAGSTPALATKSFTGQGILHPWIDKEGRNGKE